MSKYLLNYVVVFALGVLFYFSDSGNPLEDNWDLFRLVMFVANFLIVAFCKGGKR